MHRTHQMRRMCIGALLALPLWGITQPVVAQTEPALQMTPLTYPETRRGDVVDDHFGTEMADPYRWLKTKPPATLL